MFAWLKRSKPAPAAPIVLFFKDGEAALAYSNSYGDTKLAEGEILPALVLDAHSMFGAAAPQTLSNGIQQVALRVSSKEGGFLVMADAADASGPELRSGDLVAWQALQLVPELVSVVADSRSAWVGFILAILKPEYTPGRGWSIGQRFER